MARLRRTLFVFHQMRQTVKPDDGWGFQRKNFLLAVACVSLFFLFSLEIECRKNGQSGDHCTGTLSFHSWGMMREKK